MKNLNDDFLNFETKFHKIDGQGATQLKRFFQTHFSTRYKLASRMGNSIIIKYYIVYQYTSILYGIM